MMLSEKEKLIQVLIQEGYLKTPGIIEAFRVIDRKDFVRPEYRGEAYGNYPLPIGEGQTISQPLTVAFMLELLDPRPGEKILDVGAGSGWTTALLAHCVSQKENQTSKIPPRRGEARSTKLSGKNQNVGKVYAIERIEELCKFGEANIRKYNNFIEKGIIKFFCQDGTLGLPEEAPFDKILAGAAALQEIPQAWRDQLKINGRIVAPVRGSIWVFIKKSETELEEIEHPGFAFVPLVRDDQRQTTDDKRPETKKQKKSPKKYIIGVALIFSLSAFGLFASEIYRPHSSFRGAKSIEIAPGLGSRQIAQLFKKEGVIRSKTAFMIYVLFKGNAAELKPGSYVFDRDPIPVIVGTLERGGTNERVITIPEGWSAKDIAGYLEREGLASSKVFLDLIHVQRRVLNMERFDFLADKPANTGLEGYLFPDTYRIFRDAKPEDIVAKMLENFGKKITPELRQEPERQQKTLFEVITMASLIEKEVRTDEDRAIVSGILWKRLRAGIALQVDATITYITGKKTTKISREETRIDSPYNTYKYRGLPKGPISNPGLSAIRAAIYPNESPYLYYLSAPDDRTIFSRTLEEHNKAKARYLR